MDCKEFVKELDLQESAEVPAELLQHAADCENCEKMLAAHKKMFSGFETLKKVSLATDVTAKVLASTSVSPSATGPSATEAPVSITARLYLAIIAVALLIAGVYTIGKNEASNHGVILQTLEGNTLPLNAKQSLKAKDTGSIRFANGNMFSLQKDSIIIPLADGINVISGKMTFSIIQQKDSEFKITTPHGTVTITEAKLEIDVTAKQTEISIISGTARLNTEYGQKLLMSGEKWSSDLEDDSKLLQKQELHEKEIQKSPSRDIRKQD